MIKGVIEPGIFIIFVKVKSLLWQNLNFIQDRYVMIGNHRDAWVFGSVDPTSGTAALVEISRALSVLKQDHGWQPRRSILFLSWGSEEYGLMGNQS